MRAYIEPFLAYLLVPIILGFLGVNATISIALKIVVVGGLLYTHRSSYMFKWGSWKSAFLVGVVVFLLWVGLEGRYPILGSSEVIPVEPFYLILRLISALMLAPLVEEFFTRSFLNRALQAGSLEGVPPWRFTFLSFTITTIFFGIAHTRWLPALFSGALLNLLLIYRKDMGSVVMAHFVANALLFTYAALSAQWTLLG